MAFAASLHASLRDAATAIAAVAAGRSLAQGFATAGEADEVPSSRAAVLDLVHGTLRAYGRWPAITRAMSVRDQNDPLVEALLWCSLQALASGRHTPYTVVDQAVRACTALGKGPARGFVNALLRRYLREADHLESAIAAEPEVRWAHPRWWIERVREEMPGEWEAALAAGNLPPPMTLRVNLRRGDVAGYVARLAAQGIAGTPLEGEALLLPRPMPVAQLPGFAEGEVSVQDAGAQRAAGLLGAVPGMRVLDACAAPGGKCAHVLERAEVELTAIDVDAARCARIESNLARLGLRADVRAADCTRLEAWWDGRAYDRVLADVPCTGSGVVRRHPDIKWLRRPGDAARFAARQGAILDALWRVLRPGGTLLYVTCSVFIEENEAVVDAFCRRTPHARPLPLPDDRPARTGPGPDRDGFFHALIARDG